MKKTLTVNLGGTVYHIDEDAYKLLDNYLNDLRCHFGKSTDAEEIVQDMETRIAELFNEYIKDGRQVITLHEVEEVIARMGNPEELNDGIGEEYTARIKGAKLLPRRRYTVCSEIRTTVSWEVCFPDSLRIWVGT